jgi:hypothetical protein
MPALQDHPEREEIEGKSEDIKARRGGGSAQAQGWKELGGRAEQAEMGRGPLQARRALQTRGRVR